MKKKVCIYKKKSLWKAVIFTLLFSNNALHFQYKKTNPKELKNKKDNAFFEGTL